MRTAQDFLSLTSKIQMDLRATQAKVTELRAWIANLDLPEEAKVFSEEKALAVVRNTAHVYTESSLADELALQGADREFIDQALLVAAEVRRATKDVEGAPV